MRKNKKVLKKLFVACISGGKDSTYMLHLILHNLSKYPLDYVLFVNTGMEFKAVYDVLEKIKRLLTEKNIPLVEIDISEEFKHCMFTKEVCKQGTNEVHRIGYGWCGGVCRWGTSCKTQALERFYKKNFADYEVIEYVGIAYDEPERLEKDICGKGKKLYPLVIDKITEGMCLLECYKLGYNWKEEGIYLYEILDRLSCWCCKNKNLKELKAIFYKLPNYWNKLKQIEALIGEPMKGEGKSLLELEKRFLKEGYQINLFEQAGYPICEQ